MTEEHTEITLKKDVDQRGEIKVAAQIIQDLSSGVYSTPAVALKELINNSYDADAVNVTVRMLPDLDTMLIADDGEGMNAKDFDNNFAWISKSNKRNNGLFTSGKYSKAKRPLIGKIGIGFIAINEICNKMEIESSKEGEDIKFTATIDFTEIGPQRKEDKNDLKSAKKQANDERDENGVLRGTYILRNENEEKEKHYTIIRLVGIKETAQKILHNELYKSNIGKSEKVKRRVSDFKNFNNMKDLLEIHDKRELHTYMQDDEYIQFVIELAAYIPVGYIKHGPIEGVNDKIIKEIVKEQEDLNFNVDLDGIYLKKPIFFPYNTDIKYEYHSFKEEIELEDKTALKFKGYFYCQNKLLSPRELNGVSVRIKGVPIARRFGIDRSFLDYANYTDQLFRNWVSGEIYIEEGLEDAMNIDRQSFRETQPSFIALQNYLHKLLREKIFGEFAMSLYTEGKEIRQAKKRKTQNRLEKKIIGANKVEIETVEDFSDNIPSNMPLTLERKGDTAKIVISRSRINRYHKKDWLQLEPIILIFEDAVQKSEGDIIKLKKLFYSGIDTYLKKQKK